MSDRTIRYAVAALFGASLLAWSSLAGAFSYTNPNCANGASWPNLPVQYEINGSDVQIYNNLVSIIEASFQEWSDPCCSTFQATNVGTTSLSALDVRGDASANPVLSWIERESNWPDTLGDPDQVLGVTMSSFRGCDIANAPIIFNGSRSYQRIDLQSIATHEIGHLLGLGHTPRGTDATMRPSYPGGTSQRTIEQDDIDGVCSMYGGGTCGCQSDSDCPQGEQCNSSDTCEEIPCQSDADCSGGKECNTSTGDCEVPTCSTDADCTKRGYECNQSTGKCELGCRVCKSCQNDDDCGTPDDQWGCVSTEGGRNFCIRACPESGCPGDSTCKDVEFETRRGTRTIPICLNPGACIDKDSTLCPNPYICGEGQVVNNCSVQSNPGDDTGPSTSDAGPTSDVDAGGPTSRDSGTSGGDDASNGETTTPGSGSDAVSGSDVTIAVQQDSEDPSSVSCGLASDDDGPAGLVGFLLFVLGGLVVRRGRRRS